MPLCTECEALVSLLHDRMNGKVTYKPHKSVLEILKSSPDCDLCNLVVSVEFKWQDNFESPVASLSYFNNERYIHAWEGEVATDLGLDEKVKVGIILDVCERVSEVVFEFQWLSLEGEIRRGRLWLAVWKDTPCADVPLETECLRHKPDFISEHMLESQPANNRWAQFQACASSDVAYRKYGALVDDESEETLNYLNEWLRVCECSHGLCMRSLAGKRIDGRYSKFDSLCFPWEDTDAPLPHRVLAIYTDHVKLVETKEGQTGCYVALSHCWGSSENHPLKTTKENYAERLAGVPLEDLPKTFRDAVKITKHIGVKHLWIDSLCIIQDDIEDWKQEAAKMGAVYEYARLTIAAADAKDSTEGCFVTARPDLEDIHERVKALRAETITETSATVEENTDRPSIAQRTSPPNPPRITVQSIGRNDVPVTIHLAATPWQNYHPYYTRLGTRAWARQEWYLSRRMLFFTRGGILWKCRQGEWNEREVYFDMEEKRLWPELLQRYSADELTYETDRLVALEGVASQMKTLMDGSYHFGVWTHMLELLLWVMSGREYEVKGPEAPSWSFARRSGPKFYWKTMVQFGFNRSAVDLTKSGLRIDETGVLSTTAPMASLVATETSRNWIAAQNHIPWKCSLVPESALLYFAHATSRPVLFLFDPGNPNRETAIGLASLDDAVVPDCVSTTSQVKCILLVSCLRLCNAFDRTRAPIMEKRSTLLFRDSDENYVGPSRLPSAIPSPQYLENQVPTIELPEQFEEMEWTELMKYNIVFDTSEFGDEAKVSVIFLERG
jgi:hypothetical protein